MPFIGTKVLPANCTYFNKKNKVLGAGNVSVESRSRWLWLLVEGQNCIQTLKELLMELVVSVICLFMSRWYLFYPFSTHVHRGLSKIGNVFFFSWSAWCQHQLKWYFIERERFWENGSKLKETTVNYFALRHHQSRVHVRPESYGLLLYLLLKLLMYDCLPNRFFRNVSTSYDKYRKLKSKVNFNLCLNLLYVFTFSLLAILVSWFSSG